MSDSTIKKTNDALLPRYFVVAHVVINVLKTLETHNALQWNMVFNKQYLNPPFSFPTLLSIVYGF